MDCIPAGRKVPEIFVVQRNSLQSAQNIDQPSVVAPQFPDSGTSPVEFGLRSMNSRGDR
jgi:hypothetical protein